MSPPAQNSTSTRTPRRPTLCSGEPGAGHIILTSADGRLTRCPTTIATWELSYKYNFIPLSWRKEVLGKIDTPQARMINRLEKVARHLLSNDHYYHMSRCGLRETGPGGRTGSCVTSLPCWPVCTPRVSRGPPLRPPGESQPID